MALLTRLLTSKAIYRENYCFSIYCTQCSISLKFYLPFCFLPLARFKHRILHAPNRIAELNVCKMRRLNQLNATYFN